jgi:KDO2-lipid IV(A) lauroyltransferase
MTTRLEWLRGALRFDGAGWRRFAELGCVYGPEWWKRGSPPVIAGIIYAIARNQRAAVRRNQRIVCGERSPWREQRDAYRVFAEFARSLTESMEQWGPRPHAIELRVVNGEVFERALAERRGLVAVTGHFGSWEIGARYMGHFGRPVSMVTAHEANPTVREYVHNFRTRHGFKVIYSDRSLFAGLPILQALRRHEIVGVQIEPWGPLPGSQTVDFFGRTTRFQLGPFAVARVARAPVVPVFAVRTGIRRYELRVVGRFDPRTAAESVAALRATVQAYEALIREVPSQWLMFEDVWPVANGAPATRDEGSVPARTARG